MRVAAEAPEHLQVDMVVAEEASGVASEMAGQTAAAAGGAALD